MSQSTEERRSDRYLSEAVAGSATTSEGSIPIALTNISQEGFSAITDHLVAIDRPIRIEAAGIAREARIIWQNDVTIGAEFLSPLTPEELRAILSGSPAAI